MKRSRFTLGSAALAVASFLTVLPAHGGLSQTGAPALGQASLPSFTAPACQTGTTPPDAPWSLNVGFTFERHSRASVLAGRKVGVLSNFLGMKGVSPEGWMFAGASLESGLVGEAGLVFPVKIADNAVFNVGATAEMFNTSDSHSFFKLGGIVGLSIRWGSSGSSTGNVVQILRDRAVWMTSARLSKDKAFIFARNISFR